jgi:hypothetical protein
MPDPHQTVKEWGNACREGNLWSGHEIQSPAVGLRGQAEMGIQVCRDAEPICEFELPREFQAV